MALRFRPVALRRCFSTALPFQFLPAKHMPDRKACQGIVFETKGNNVWIISWALVWDADQGRTV